MMWGSKMDLLGITEYKSGHIAAVTAFTFDGSKGCVADSFLLLVLSLRYAYSFFRREVQQGLLDAFQWVIMITLHAQLVVCGRTSLTCTFPCAYLLLMSLSIF